MEKLKEIAINICYIILISFFVLTFCAGKVTVESYDRILTFIFIVGLFNSLQIYQLNRKLKKDDKPETVKVVFESNKYMTVSGEIALCVRKILNKDEFIMTTGKDTWLVDSKGKALYGKGVGYDIERKYDK